MTDDHEARISRARADGRRLSAIYRTALYAVVIAMAFRELPANAEHVIVQWLWIDVVATSAMAIIALVIWVRSGQLGILSLDELVRLSRVLYWSRPISQSLAPVFLFALYADGRMALFAAYVALTVLSQFLLLRRIALTYQARQS